MQGERGGHMVRKRITQWRFCRYLGCLHLRQNHPADSCCPGCKETENARKEKCRWKEGRPKHRQRTKHLREQRPLCPQLTTQLQQSPPSVPPKSSTHLQLMPRHPVANHLNRQVFRLWTIVVMMVALMTKARA